MKNLNAKVGEMEYDGLVVDLVPEVEVRGGTIRKLAAATTLKRGTILAKSSKDIEEFLGIKKNPDYFKGMLDAWSKYNRSENGEYIYTTFDLEEVRSLTNCS